MRGWVGGDRRERAVVPVNKGKVYMARNLPWGKERTQGRLAIWGMELFEKNL